ncbi:ABC-type nitrate/sulfonate/bicarbonate transport system substrate-binding protein [Arthrobacter bambusae]|uniref:ABC-type nitrate/sulfonate/bicarbonate transport system substrate-binding protein n=1 Tax=Arthrobacter bambusae TaxID=1338426 RepID=A0ABV2P122_9MICC
MKKRSMLPAVLGAIAATALVLAGCSSGPSGEAKPDPAQLRVGLFSPDVTFSAFYASIGSEGALTKVLKERNIELKIETIPSGSNLVAALASGSVDAAIVPGTSVLGVASQGGQIVPLMNMFDGPSQQVIGNTASKLGGPGDIKVFDKKRWAFTRVGSISEISAKLTAESAGLKWNEQERLPLGSGSETQAVLESGRADVLSTSPNNSATAVASGAAYLVANPQEDESLRIAKQLNAVFASSPSFVSAHPDLTQEIVTALVKELSVLSTAKSASESLAPMTDEFKNAVGKSWDLQWDYSKSGFSRATGGFSKDELEQTVVGAKLVAVVKEDFTPPAELFSNSFVAKAYEKLSLKAPSGIS